MTPVCDAYLQLVGGLHVPHLDDWPSNVGEEGGGELSSLENMYPKTETNNRRYTRIDV